MNFQVYNRFDSSVQSPRDAARSVYAFEPCARTFEEDLELHFRHGYVLSTPSVFVMGRAIDSGAPHSCIVDPSVDLSRGADCWHVYLCAGELDGLRDLIPYHLPLVSWERCNQLRFYELERVMRQLCRYMKRRSA